MSALDPNEIYSVHFKNADMSQFRTLQIILEKTENIKCEIDDCTRDLLIANVPIDADINKIEIVLQKTNLGFCDYQIERIDSKNDSSKPRFRIQIRNLDFLRIEEFMKMVKNQFGEEIEFKTSDTKLIAFNFRSLYNMLTAVDNILLIPREDMEFEFVIPETSNLDCLPFEWTYAKQLELKQMYYRMILHSLTTVIRKTNAMCSSVDIVPTYPIQTATDGAIYRNVIEVVFQKTEDGTILPTLRVNYNQSNIDQLSIYSIPFIHESAKRAIKAFSAFLKNSQCIPFDPETGLGHINLLRIRMSITNGEVMLIVGVHSPNTDLYQREIIITELTRFYQDVLHINFNFTSLYYEEIKIDSIPHEFRRIDHLHGSTHIMELIDDVKFYISPLENYPINKNVAELILRNALGLLKPKSDSTILIDLGCGSGVLSLVLSKYFLRIFGIDESDSAILEANENMQKNLINNVHFINCDPLEAIGHLMESIEHNFKDQYVEVIILIHSPQANLDNKSIATIRNLTKVQRIVFISNIPQNSLNNWTELCLPESERYKGPPFLPVVNVAYDSLPQTAHFCILMKFKRIFDCSSSEE